MNWFNSLAETYDHVSDIVGLTDDDGNTLLPSNHMTKKSDLNLVLDGDGKFMYVTADVLTIIIPCTDDSASRSGKAIFPQPLHEELGYICYDAPKRKAYMKQLSAWKDRNPKVSAVYTYLLGGTILDDLHAAGLPTDLSDIDPVKKDGTPKKQKELENDLYKRFVRFSVMIPGDLKPNLWEDETVAEAWNDYLAENDSGEQALCYVLGKVAPTTQKHPKGVNPATNGAKLISCNDNTNYTYRGRFIEPEQSNAISAEASSKAHAMLKYLIATQGYKCDTQAIVAWATDTGDAAVNPLASTKALVDKGAEDDVKPEDENSEVLEMVIESDHVETDSDRQIEAGTQIYRDYADALREALCGLGNANKLKKTARKVAVIAVDAATTGRMSVVFYQDMPENDYIERILQWHESCRWCFGYGNNRYISTPSVDRIIAAVFGEPRGEGYNKIKKQARERLLQTIICKARIDLSWVRAAQHRVAFPLSYEKRDGGWDRWGWLSALDTACALIKKYYNDKGEAFTLELNTEFTDRDYNYGRLLAYADYLETIARYDPNKKDDDTTKKNDNDKRPTNAVRYMSAFSTKPFSTWSLIYKQLNPYIQKLNGAEWFQKQMDEIISLCDYDEFISDKPLSGKYLIGYSLQRKAFIKTKENTKK